MECVCLLRHCSAVHFAVSLGSAQQIPKYISASCKGEICNGACCELQIQEELESLAKQATANAMNTIKCEKHVFTNNNSYMQLLNKMKAFVLRKQQFFKTQPGLHYYTFSPTKEEVSECCLSLQRKGLVHTQCVMCGNLFAWSAALLAMCVNRS